MFVCVMASTSKCCCSSGTLLRGQAQEIVFNVYSHLKEQKTLHKLKYNVVEATSDSMGVSETLVNIIAAEGKQSLDRASLTFSAAMGKKRLHKKKIVVDSFIHNVIRRKIHNFYVVKKEFLPTLKKN